MDLEKHLEKAESLWLSSSIDYLKTQFSKTPLPSHDHHHHLRVWNNAKNLLRQLSKQNIIPDFNFVEALLLSSMFHDSGMIKVKGDEHGKAGVGILHEFLDKEKQQPASKVLIEKAIEKHDDKSFSLTGRLLVEGKIQLLPALHISDDLDAMGHIGIYRYSEIYLLRGIAFEDLGLKIIANLSGRYGNFITNCSRLPEMIMKHSVRHHTIESFFRFYNLQVRKIEETGEDQKSGPVGVVKNIYRQVLMNTPTIEEISKNILDSTEDVYIQNFFKSLMNEV
jgi:HD superfamily phosphodiesterase